MSGEDRGQVLSSSEVIDYYGRLGKKLDYVNFYGFSALKDLIANADFESATNLFEFGCGTGKFAARLLKRHLQPDTRYLGVDASPEMVKLAKSRLKAYPKQALVMLSEKPVQLPPVDGVADRIISTYVLDLLPEDDIALFFEESYRALSADGKLCLVSLHQGKNLPSRIVSRLWQAAFERRPDLVGGCRPIDLDLFINRNLWRIAYRKVRAPFGVASEVWILEKIAKKA